MELEKRKELAIEIQPTKWGASEISLKVELTRDERSVLARIRKVDDVKMFRTQHIAPAKPKPEEG